MEQKQQTKKKKLDKDNKKNFIKTQKTVWK